MVGVIQAAHIPAATMYAPRYLTIQTHLPKKTIKADMELALRLQAEFEGEGKSTSTRALDPDEEFARKLQQEEERNRPSGVPCQLCTEVVGTDQLFILDVCFNLLSTH